MEDLIQHYRATRRRLRALRTLQQDQAERQVLAEMISDCDYVLEWLCTGRRPGNKRGIERRASYQRERPVDPLRMQAYVQRHHAGSPSNITEWQRYQITDALSRLSDRERDCYVMARGECHSYAEIAEMLGIGKSTVEEYVSRAERKITADLQSSLFLVC